MIRCLAAAALWGALVASTPAHAVDRLTVLLDWFVNPDHAPLIVAREAGIFARHDLEVELVAPADPNLPPRLVAAGQADIAVSYQPNLYLQTAEGLPLRRIGTLVDTPLNCLAVLDDGPVKSLADLKGRKIGYSIAGFEEALLGEMLEGAGLTLEDVELVNVNFALTTSLMSRQVDAVIGAFRNFEMTQIRLAGGAGRAFFPEENGVPTYDELVYVARVDAAGDPRLPRFLAAVEEATIFLINRPDDAWAMFIKAHPDLDDELNRTAWRDTLPRFAKRPALLDEARYDAFGAFMSRRGLVKSAPAVGDIAMEIAP